TQADSARSRPYHLLCRETEGGPTDAPTLPLRSDGDAIEVSPVVKRRESEVRDHLVVSNARPDLDARVIDIRPELGGRIPPEPGEGRVIQHLDCREKVSVPRGDSRELLDVGIVLAGKDFRLDM